ncbi:hypothetical protein UA08_06318 [Talaromyces atroroseus]|uniref:Zn(2)-C6 fungal-type domain-containing protein n=1 Tax=Talaromyces atroroseus TaxID=1441469 RepID=A0A225AZ01_TALAT|nr:hypothetical protein UA08_06318 [Talaromyces atroroseus]OKL58737.1 hypothetical protein UA08_06318 [Talaromyces atroroseus]
MSAPRRNGLPSSCEPCRKSKLRCDHATPCGRCRRRKRPAQCIYHPAPMTKRMSPETARARRTLPSPDTSSAGNTGNTTPPKNADSCSEGPLRAKLIADWSKKTSSSPGTGVLGPTSYSAVYEESEDVIKSSATSFQDLSQSLRRTLTTVDDVQIQLGAELLLFLYDDLTLYERMVLSKLSHCDGHVFSPSIIRLVFASVRHMLTAAIEDQSDPLPDLFKLSKRIFENCSKPIRIDAHMTPQDYFISMPYKWEVIALIFSIIGASVCILPVSYLISIGFNTASLDPKGLAHISIAAGDKCIKFCENAGIMSEPLSWALLSHAALLTLVYGDHDYRAWKVVGDLCTLVFALGYHQKQNSVMLPFFLVEHRKRLLLGAYAIDKELATFLGRPPRISWRHIDIDLPLDISYEELLAEPEIRDAAIARLDKDGWSSNGTVSKISFARAMFVMGRVRELVLELSLNSRIDDIESRIEQISKIAKETRNTLPARFHKGEINTMTGLQPEITFMSLYFDLDCLYNEFIMQRILVKRTGRGSNTLKRIAHGMLDTLLALTGSRAPDGTDNNTVAWNVSFFGLPCAGILAIELLRQSQNAQTDSRLPRSEVIQNLSRFAADLEYAVPREAGNYEICQQARKVIRSILDHVLSAPPVPLTPGSAEVSSVPVEWFTSNEFWLDQDSEFMRWINNFDWNQDLTMADTNSSL